MPCGSAIPIRANPGQSAPICANLREAATGPIWIGEKS
jgi:hypothetical protein